MIDFEKITKMKRSDYKEILKLKSMLEKNHIPFDFNDNHFDGYHIIYPKEGKRVCSVIENFGSYGAFADLLEIQGLLTDEEKAGDDVLGYLTAENVFERINEHYINEIKNGKK